MGNRKAATQFIVQSIYVSLYQKITNTSIMQLNLYAVGEAGVWYNYISISIRTKSSRTCDKLDLIEKLAVYFGEGR